MGVYLGEITFKNNFVNFKPYYEYSGGKFSFLNRFDRQTLLPESQLGTINFYSTSPEAAATDMFYDGEFLLFDFELSELEDNFTRGERNYTGYKINISQLPAGKIRRMPDLGYFYCVPAEHVEGNYKTNTALIITDMNVHEEMKVFIPLPGSTDTLLGPFDVNFREYDNQCIVKTNFANQKYIIWGYKFGGGYESCIEEFGNFDNERRYIKIGDGVGKKVPVDVLPKEALLKGFRDTIGSESFADGKLDLQNIDTLLDQHSSSLFIGEGIPEEIQQQRFDTLTTLLTDEEDLNDTFGFISDTIGSLLVTYQEKDGYADLIKRIADDPEFMGRIQKFKIISDRIEEREAEVQSLIKQSEELSKQIAEQREQLEAQKEQEIVATVIEKYETELHELEDRKVSIQAEISELAQKKQLVENITSLQALSDDLTQTINYKEWRERELDKSITTIAGKLDSIFTNHTEKAMNFAFDGMLSSRMLQQAAEWESQNKKKNYAAIVDQLQKIPHSEKYGDELIEYLVAQVKNYRPSYDKNTILNILVCISQGFLTVFSGEPGTGKTSICKILANTLGLYLPAKMLPASNDGFNPNRFISVSVERGWTTKRDFIGYYNPLTKSFDRSNRRIFDGLNILDAEAKGMSTNLPFVILLDEANLSPMEYYWADYMNICDDLDQNSTINLGDDFYYNVPTNLRFLATINNDHTTESLSPRLIDRAWVVRLPKVKTGAAKQVKLVDDGVEMVAWDALLSIFSITLDEAIPMSGTAKEVYDAILIKLQEAKITVSARADAAIRRYWSVAQKIFETDNTYGTDPTIVALDYAIAQRILPHINGSGKKYEEKLNAILKLCNDKNLRHSAAILSEIIQKGEDSMSYYQYFA